MSMFVGSLAIPTLWITAAILWPPFRNDISSFDGAFIGPTVVMSLAVTFLISTAFKNYAFKPEAAAPYLNPRERSLTQLCFIMLPLLFFVTAGICLHVLAGR
jgi:hypothetical protein